jgi:hypothetical protein
MVAHDSPRKQLVHTGWEIDPKCLEKKESYYYRSWDGSCNWLRKGQAKTGAQDQAYARDYSPPHYKPGTFSLASQQQKCVAS